MAIDTSCDDTAVAILQNDSVIANIVSSQDDIHREWGGVVPMLAKRAHQEYIDKCLALACRRAKINSIAEEIDIIAVTYGPGLAPALEVGLAKGQQMAIIMEKPLIPVNHMEGHLLSPLLKNSKGNYYATTIDNLPDFPWLSLTISGGHTEIVWIETIGSYYILGKTLDDAAGEAFDKIARMLGLGYPGGAVIEAMAKNGDPQRYQLPRPMHKNRSYNFSFSGLKTACLYAINDLKAQLQEQFAGIVPDYCASVQEAVVDSLLLKLKKVIKQHKPNAVLIGGGVSANLRLRHKFRKMARQLIVPMHFPHKKFCMDNAAMIGLAAYFKYRRGEFATDKSAVDRVPTLSIECRSYCQPLQETKKESQCPQ